MGCPPYAINGYGASITPYAPGAPTECTPGTMNLDGLTPSLFASKFAQAAKVDLTGISDSAAGSCVTCHDAHKPLNENFLGMSTSLKTECTDCHSSPTATISPQVDLAVINHIGGTPETERLFKTRAPILRAPAWSATNLPVSSTSGGSVPIRITRCTVTTPTPTPSMAPAPLVPRRTRTFLTTQRTARMRKRCGSTSITHAANATAEECLRRTSLRQDLSLRIDRRAKYQSFNSCQPNGFASGKEVTIKGAGYAGADFKTIIASVSGNTVYLTYPTVTTVTNAVVTVAGNPTKNSAMYLTRAQLSAFAKNIHRNLPPASVALFSATLVHRTHSR